MLFISTWLYGFITICLAILLDPFITIWIGSEYLIPKLASLAAVLYILIDGMEFASHTYISTLGYFKQTRFSSLICAVINIVLSILLGLKFGLFGIFISTSISKILTTTWFDTYVIYKNEFNKSAKSYYIKHFLLLISVCINYLICVFLTNLIPDGNIYLFVIKAIATAVLCNIIFIIMFYNTKDFKKICNRLGVKLCKN